MKNIGNFLRGAWKENRPLVIAEIIFAVGAGFFGLTFTPPIKSALAAITFFLVCNLGLILLGVWIAHAAKETSSRPK